MCFTNLNSNFIHNKNNNDVSNWHLLSKGKELNYCKKPYLLLQLTESTSQNAMIHTAGLVVLDWYFALTWKAMKSQPKVMLVPLIYNHKNRSSWLNLNAPSDIPIWKDLSIHQNLAPNFSLLKQMV